MTYKLKTALAILAAVAMTAVATVAIAADTFAGLRLQTLQTSPSEKIDVALWYPTSTPSQATTIGPHVQDVAMGAPASTGPFPLIVISHGTGGMNMNHHELAAALARGGFVVAALTHPGDNYKDRSSNKALARSRRAPIQVTALSVKPYFIGSERLFPIKSTIDQYRS